MMTGKPPFDGKSINALYKRIKKIDYKIPSYFSKGKKEYIYLNKLLFIYAFFFFFFFKKINIKN